MSDAAATTSADTSEDDLERYERIAEEHPDELVRLCADALAQSMKEANR